jgi:hypothetical protein
MTPRRFRVAEITFNEVEEVSTVTIVVAVTMLPTIAGMLARTVSDAATPHSDGYVSLSLSLEDTVRLHDAASDYISKNITRQGDAGWISASLAVIICAFID